MTPNIARLRNYTYSLSILLDFDIQICIFEGNDTIMLPSKQINGVLLGKVPIIVQSKYCVYNNNIFSECKYDVGGYTIINGNEKVLITQEKVIPNIIQVYKNSKNQSILAFG